MFTIQIGGRILRTVTHGSGQSVRFKDKSVEVPSMKFLVTIIILSGSTRLVGNSGRAATRGSTPALGDDAAWKHGRPQAAARAAREQPRSQSPFARSRKMTFDGLPTGV